MSNTLLDTNSSIEAFVQPRTLEAMKAQYQLDQQEKFLSIRAEAETLLQQLQAIKQQRQGLSNSNEEA